jgi:hypothetical protein
MINLRFSDECVSASNTHFVMIFSIGAYILPILRQMSTANLARRHTAFFTHLKILLYVNPSSCYNGRD